MKIILLLAVAVGLAVAWQKEMENPGLFQGDMVLTPDQLKDATEGRLGYGSVNYGRWPGAKVPYQIEGSIAAAGRTAISQAVAEYHRSTCLRFRVRNGDRQYISFFRGGGCFSPIGMQRSGNRISLAQSCWHKGTVMHEIGHSLGLFHEQARQDRDRYVTIHWNNIQRGMASQFKIQNDINSLGTEYDLASMMHYSSTAFAFRGRKSITTKDPSKQHLIDTYNRISGFSPIDIKQLGIMYCGGTGGGTLTQAPPTCHDATDCTKYDRGYCRSGRYQQWMRMNCKKYCSFC